MNNAIDNLMDTGNTEEECEKAYREICDSVGIEISKQVCIIRFKIQEMGISLLGIK